MVVTPFLRRETGGTEEYLFLTAEQDEATIQNPIVNPTLPKDEADLETGDLAIALGFYKVTFRVVGTLVPLAAADFPSLDTSETSPGSGVATQSYLYASGATGVDASASAQTAKDIRHSIFQFIADTSDTTHSNYRFGYPEWSDVETETPISGGEDYKLWRVVPVNFYTRRVAGEDDQYYYALDLAVADL